MCTGNSTPKAIKIFSDNEPWVTKEIETILNKKKTAFKNKNSEERRKVKKKLKAIIRKGKEEYSKKIEKSFESSNMKRVWEILSMMMI